MSAIWVTVLAFVIGVVVGDVLKPLSRWGSKN